MQQSLYNAATGEVITINNGQVTSMDTPIQRNQERPAITHGPELLGLPDNSGPSKPKPNYAGAAGAAQNEGYLPLPTMDFGEKQLQHDDDTPLQLPTMNFGKAKEQSPTVTDTDDAPLQLPKW